MAPPRPGHTAGRPLSRRPGLLEHTAPARPTCRFRAKAATGQPSVNGVTRPSGDGILTVEAVRLAASHAPARRRPGRPGGWASGPDGGGRPPPGGSRFGGAGGVRHCPPRSLYSPYFPQTRQPRHGHRSDAEGSPDRRRPIPPAARPGGNPSGWYPRKTRPSDRRSAVEERSVGWETRRMACMRTRRIGPGRSVARVPPRPVTGPRRTCPCTSRRDLRAGADLHTGDRSRKAFGDRSRRGEQLAALRVAGVLRRRLDGQAVGSGSWG